jgi:arsenate reductase
MDAVIWHNPRCSKSRATLALLESRAIAPVVRRYLDNLPNAAEITAAAALLGIPLLGIPLRDMARRDMARRR